MDKTLLDSDSLLQVILNSSNNRKEEFFDKLYSQESSCLLLFRSLIPACQHVILRLLNIDLKELQLTHNDLLAISWFDSTKRYSDIVKILLTSKILAIDESKCVVFNKNFISNFRNLNESGLTSNFFTRISTKKNKSYYEKCFTVGYKKLESFLRNIFLIENYNDTDELGGKDEFVHFLFASEQILKEKDYNRASKRFRLSPNFINLYYKDRQTQLKNLVKNYIKVYEKTCTDLSKYFEFVNFLFNLCTLEVGQAYSFQNLSSENLKHLEQLKFFGLVLIDKVKEKKDKKVDRFFVTPLIKCLFESSYNFQENVENFRFLFIETNFTFFAYVTSELDKTLLESLCDINYVFQGMIVGSITRDSIRRALKREISYKNILQYFDIHAHPLCNYRTVIGNNVYNIPENVAQQIYVWDQEKNALETHKCLLIEDFSDESYNKFLAEIRSKGKINILWEDSVSKRVAIDRKQEELVLKIANKY